MTDKINPGVSPLWVSIFVDQSPVDEKNFLEKKKYVEEKLPLPPIIIGGCGRSGTTVLHAILSAHPEIFALSAETCCFCPTAYGRLQKPIEISKINLTAPFDTDIFYGKCFNGDIPQKCKRWCEKTPRNVLFFGRILKHFGNYVRIIHMVRDGRDVILSSHPSNPSKFWIDIERWIAEVSAGLLFFNHPEVLTVRYEDLILNFSETIDLLCSFLNIPVLDEIINWHEYATHRIDPSWKGDVLRLHPESIGKWRKEEWLTSENIRIINMFMENDQAVSLMQKLGYL